MSQLKAGVARANVTPPVGMLMSGYASRTTPAEGIHDELNTVAVYLTDGEMEAALITTDIISANAEGVARVREACTAACGVPSENILVAFAHNHGGPQTDLRRSDSVDELKRAYGTVLVHKMAGALSEAKKDAVPVRMGYGRQDCYFGKNRREHKDGRIVIGYNPDGPTSPIVDVLRLDRLDTGDPLSLIFSYACHGTVMRADNLLYTAEFSGIAKTFIDEQIPTARSAFMAFCSGDIDPWPHDKFEQVERYGRQLGCAVVQAALDNYGRVDILWEFIDIVEGPVNAKPHHALVPLGLYVDIARPLFKGITEEVVDGVDNVLVRGGEFISGSQAYELLQISQVHRRHGKLVLRRCNGALKTEKLVDQLDDIRLTAHNGLDLEMADPCDVLHHLHVEGVGRGDHQIPILDGYGKDQVLYGKGMGDGGSHQIEIQFQGIDLPVGDLPGLCQDLENGLFVQGLGRVVLPLQAKGGDDIHEGHRIGNPSLCRRRRLAHGPHLFQLPSNGLFLFEDGLFLIL